ncbi:hypothetical protein [Paracoccus sediminilitoris]|nr:hypothetical protein [Paracoccus sediminilitoris]
MYAHINLWMQFWATGTANRLVTAQLKSRLTLSRLEAADFTFSHGKKG